MKNIDSEIFGQCLKNHKGKTSQREREYIISFRKKSDIILQSKKNPTYLNREIDQQTVLDFCA